MESTCPFTAGPGSVGSSCSFSGGVSELEAAAAARTVAAAATAAAAEAAAAAATAAASAGLSPAPPLISQSVVAVASLALLLVSLLLLFLRHRERQRQASSVRKGSKGQVAGKAAGKGKGEEAEGEEATGASQAGPPAVEVVVLFGTQTGTAEGFAKTLTEEVQTRYGTAVRAYTADLDEFAASDDTYAAKFNSQSQPVALFVVATYGDGEPTDNSARFCRWLSKAAAAAAEAEDNGCGGDASEAAKLVLQNLRYAVFGLGNRQYEHFNAVGKLMDKQLHSLGALRLTGVGLGDDDRSIEDDFTAWQEQLWGPLEEEIRRRTATQPTRNGVHHQQGKMDEAGEESDALLLHSASLTAAAASSGRTPGDEYEVVIHGTEGEEGKEGLAYEVAGQGKGEDKARVAMAVGVEEVVRSGSSGSHGWHGHTVESVAVVQCRELHTATSERSCVHVELDILGNDDDNGSRTTKNSLHYEPGDHVAIFPQNSDADVAAAAQRLGLDPSTVFSLSLASSSSNNSSSSASIPFLTPMSVATALRCFVDLHSSPRKAALSVLAAYCYDAAHEERLRHLASPAGKDEYREWVQRSHRSLLEVLQAFPSARPPLNVFLTAIAPRLQPRFYSISSSHRYHPGRLSITCAVVDDITPGGREHKGVCSFFLKRIGNEIVAEPLTGKDNNEIHLTGQNGVHHNHDHNLPARSLPSTHTPVFDLLLAHVPAFVRPSTFRLPADSSTPIVMIGPGTGIAPFRGFLQERMWLLQQQPALTLGPALLFFGCRSKHKDFIYEYDLEAFKAAGALSRLWVAFSRDDPHRKVYVQDLLRNEAAEVWRLVQEQRGHLYVCGDAKSMAKDVHQTLLAIVQEQGRISHADAESLLEQMHSEGRYQRDVW